jgi:uncharacterized protein
MDRRGFLRTGAVAGVAAALGPAFWHAAYADGAQPGVGPYGPPVGPDDNGLWLPEGFRSRVIARSGLPVPGTAYLWPIFPDGAATFAAPGGGWWYVVNSEVPAGLGGASAIKFGAYGIIEDAYRILSGTSGNCADVAGGEEAQAPSNVGEGQVWECDPTQRGQGVVRPAMGAFNHEAVAVDPAGKRLYLTEDRPDGRLYRFTPEAYPDLSTGLLEVAVVQGDRVSWLPVPDPSASQETTRTQVPASTAFDGGEGCWYDAGIVYFTTKGDNRVWALDVAKDRLEVIYDAATAGPDAPLTGVDNVVVAPSGDLYVAEDGGNMEICLITPGPDRTVSPFLHYEGNGSSELTGPVFDPSGTRLYFSSQRGPAPAGTGITFEVTGPFRTGRRPAGQGGPGKGAKGPRR